jgi:hypothetical protein
MVNPTGMSVWKEMLIVLDSWSLNLVELRNFAMIRRVFAMVSNSLLARICILVRFQPNPGCFACGVAHFILELVVSFCQSSIPASLLCDWVPCDLRCFLQPSVLLIKCVELEQVFFGNRITV